RPESAGYRLRTRSGAPLRRFPAPRTLFRIDLTGANAGLPFRRVVRMKLVELPLRRVRVDVSADAVERILVADDVLIAVALPQRGAGASIQPIDFACGDGFEVLHDRAEGAGSGAPRWRSQWCHARVGRHIVGRYVVMVGAKHSRIDVGCRNRVHS